MTASQSEPTESEIAPPTVLDSRKAKIVALFVAAPNAALLFYWLYAAAHRFGLLPGTSLGTEDAGARIDAPAYGWPLWAFASAALLAIYVIPLYFASKIWRRPTLDNLRRVPFMAAVSCAFGAIVIFPLLPRFEWMPEERALRVDVRNLLALLLTLGAYFLVKNAMVLWFKTPELAQPGLQPSSRRVLWWFYCVFLWGTLNTLGDELVQHFDSALSFEDDLVVMFIQLVVFVITVYVAMYVYKKGLRLLGLRPE